MNNDPYYNFCLEEIMFYTEKINQIIKEGLKDPKKYYEETFETYKHLTRVFPYILASDTPYLYRAILTRRKVYQIRSLQSSQAKVVMTLNLSRLI